MDGRKCGMPLQSKHAFFCEQPLHSVTLTLQNSLKHLGTSQHIYNYGSSRVLPHSTFSDYCSSRISTVTEASKYSSGKTAHDGFK